MRIWDCGFERQKAFTTKNTEGTEKNCGLRIWDCGLAEG